MSEQAEQIVDICKCRAWLVTYQLRLRVPDRTCTRCSQPVRTVNITALERAAEAVRRKAEDFALRRERIMRAAEMAGPEGHYRAEGEARGFERAAAELFAALDEGGES